MKISIIIPVYNSEKILEKLITEIYENLQQFNFEVILVNDFSNDNSWNKIKKLSISNNFLKGINLQQNYGQHNAIMAGLNFGSGDIYIIMDDDLQHHPIYITKMINKVMNSFDICYTSYQNRQHRLDKIFFSNLSNFISSFVLNKPVKLYLSSFKCFNKKIRDELIKFKNPNIYIDGYLIKISNKITSIDIKHQKRHSGETNYSFKKLFLLWTRVVMQSQIIPFSINSFFVFFIKTIIFPYFLYIKLNTNLKNQYCVKEKTFNE